MWQLKIHEKKSLEAFDFRHLRFKKIFGVSVIGAVLILLFGSIYLFGFTPKLISVSASGNQNVGLQSKLAFSFNRPIDRSQIQTEIAPSINGAWHFSRPILGDHFFTRVEFEPDPYFEPEKDYKITLSNIKNVTKAGQGTDFEYEFKTLSVPKVANVSIEDGAEGISADEKIEVILDQKNDNIVEFIFSLEPEVALDTSLNSDKNKYIVTPKRGLSQGVKYAFKVSRRVMVQGLEKNEGFQEVLTRNFTTKGPPGVGSYSPVGTGVLVSTNQFAINFKEKMANDIINQISILPNVKGGWVWSGSNKIVFNVSERLQYGTTYTIKIPRGEKSLEGGFVPADIILTFTTIGHVKVMGFAPRNGQSNVAVNSTIFVTFDQEVDKTSAQNAFRLNPSDGCDFRWEGNKMICQPQHSFAQSTSVTVTVLPGVKTLAGLDSVDTFSATFITVEQVVILDVPAHIQEKPLSCEAAALKMALNYKGVGVSEDDIMAVVGYDPTPRSGDVWGDPYSAFVGSIYGHQNTTGYGVYWGPIARAAQRWRLASAFSGWGAANLAEAISNGNPVVIWGVYGSGSPDSWHTPTGKYIPAWKGEHARTAIGFKGSVSNPSAFIINDTYAGRITWSTSQLLSNWSKFGNSGVVVY